MPTIPFLLRLASSVLPNSSFPTTSRSRRFRPENKTRTFCKSSAASHHTTMASRLAKSAIGMLYSRICFSIDRNLTFYSQVQPVSGRRSSPAISLPLQPTSPHLVIPQTCRLRNPRRRRSLSLTLFPETRWFPRPPFCLPVPVCRSPPSATSFTC